MEDEYWAKVDLNCDLGEGFGLLAGMDAGTAAGEGGAPAVTADAPAAAAAAAAAPAADAPAPAAATTTPAAAAPDAQIMSYVTSINVACGFHAGDPLLMWQTVAAAKQRGVAVGAHPGYPDRAGFGRQPMDMTPEEVTAMVLYQIGALQAIAKAQGVRLQHVKPHGALYNRAAVDPDLATAIGRAIKMADPRLIYCGLAGSYMEVAAAELDLRFSREAFADRAYDYAGALVSRSLPGSVLTDPQEVAARAVRMVKHSRVATIDGCDRIIYPHTICLHGDNPQALALAQAIATQLEANHIALEPMDRLV